MTKEVEVIYFQPEHLTDVAKIASKAFIDAWPPEYFVTLMEKKNCFGLVATVDGEIAAYAIIEQTRDVIHIIQTAVANKYARQGIVSGLVDYIKLRMKMRNKKAIEADVPENGTAFINLMIKHGFRAVGVNRGQFEELDGYRFVYTVPVDDQLPDAVGAVDYLPVE